MPPSACNPTASTSTTASPAPTASAPACAKHSPPAGPGDTLAVAKLDRLARSVPDARDIVDELTARTRTRKCMANAKARGQLGGKQPTLNTREAELARCGGPVTTLASSTIHRAIQRAGPAPAASSTG